MKITLATLPQATAQQVFDQVATHLLTQGRRSQKNTYCMYRGENGLMCAAGCLIADNEYSPAWDESEIPWCFLVSGGSVPAAHQALIERLQCLHDTQHPNGWRKRLGVIASVFDLSPAVVTNFKVQQ